MKAGQPLPHHSSLSQDRQAGGCRCFRHTSSMNTFPDAHRLQMEHISGLPRSHAARSLLEESRGDPQGEARAPQ